MKINAGILVFSIFIGPLAIQEKYANAGIFDRFNRSSHLTGDQNNSCSSADYKSKAESLWEGVRDALSFRKGCLKNEYNITKKANAKKYSMDRPYFQFLEKEVTGDPKCLPISFVDNFIKVYESLENEGWDPELKDVFLILGRMEIHKDDWFKETERAGKAIFKRIPVKDGLASLIFMPDGRVILYYRNEQIGKGGEKVAFSQIELEVKKRNERNQKKPTFESVSYSEKKVIARRKADKVIERVSPSLFEKDTIEGVTSILEIDPGRSKEAQATLIFDYLTSKFFEKYFMKYGVDIRTDQSEDSRELVEEMEKLMRSSAEDMADAYVAYQKQSIQEADKETDVLRKVIELRDKRNKNVDNIALGEIVEISNNKTVVIQTKYDSDLKQAGYPEDARELELLLKGIATGIANFHQTGLVHGDLKPGNIFIKKNVKPGKKIIPYISDFGGVFDPINGKPGTYTPGYMPLERFTKTPQLSKEKQVQWHQKKDVYSFGVMVMEGLSFRVDKMDHRKTKDENERISNVNFHRAIKSRDKLCATTASPDDQIQCKLAKIAVDCLNPDVDARLTSEDVLRRFSN